MIESEWLHTVEWGECDPAGIVFYPNFYRWFDSSAHYLMKSHGLGQTEMIARYAIVGFPLIETHAKYIRPVKWEDEVKVKSSIEANSRKTFTVKHRIFRVNGTEELCVEGHEVRIWAVKDKDTGLMKAGQLPDEIVERLG